MEQYKLELSEQGRENIEETIATLMEAAQEIANSSEQDFEHMKSKKWYKRLWELVTCSRDNEKITARGVSNLAKLNEIVMKAIVILARYSADTAKLVSESLQKIDNLEDYLGSVTSGLSKVASEVKKLKYNYKKSLSLSDLNTEERDIVGSIFFKYVKRCNEDGKTPNSASQKLFAFAMDGDNPEEDVDISTHLDKLNGDVQLLLYRLNQSYYYLICGEFDDSDYFDIFDVSNRNMKIIRGQIEDAVRFSGAENYVDTLSIDDSIFCLSIDGIEMDEEEYTNEPEVELLKDEIDILKLCFSLTHLETEIISKALSNYEFDGNIVTIEILDEDEIKKDIANGEIKLQKLIDSIYQSYTDENEIVHAFRFCVMDDYNEHRHYFLIATMDGFFFFVREKIAFVEYEALKSVRQDSNGVVISAWKVNWFSEEGADESGENEIIIDNTKETNRYLGALRKGLERIIEGRGGYVESSDDKIEDIIARYIKKIPKGSSAVPYLVKDFEWDDDKSRKKMKNALSKYALKVREDEVVGFIDTSLFGNGGSGLLFSKQGIAFDYAFEKIFAKYDEIDQVEINKGKKLVLYGRFSERKNDCNNPSIENIYFNLSELKDCLEEIQCVV